ncbi:Uncharacterised protein [Leclercia adecarboxylata]|uniref:Uncharacterized protein n=1 Tax=Leclercia adecarboxylata TaxID=83655 RepID=A0A4U9HSX4_9ENTR|nr:Uncharacterised protein [Leclercia adecarboxylata]
MGGRAAQLRLEDGQRAAHIVTAHLHRTARFRETDQGDKNMLKSKRQQQTFTGTEDHRSKITGTVNDAANAGNAHGKDRPNQRDHKAKQTHHHKGDNGYKTGATKECQRVRQGGYCENARAASR